MGRSYDLDTILDALELLDQEGLSVECVFVGDGEKRAQLEARQVPGVRFTGFLEGEALERELRSADVGIVPFFPESGVVVPYKAGDYLAYHLPLLSTIDGELGRLIRTHDCGIVYEAGHTESLVAAIHRYADDVYLLNQATLGARECFESKFDRKQIYPAFADWMVSQS
jgi:glycosyltransferase involved in cell wall biosynthesis